MPAPRTGGDADISAVAALFADPTRARVLLALIRPAGTCWTGSSSVTAAR